MADLVTTEVFADGESLSGARLNNLIAAAVLQASVITGKAAITPVPGDYLLFYDLSGTVLGKATFATLFTANLGTGATTAAAGNDARFGVNVTGLRLGAGAPANDTAAKAKDLAFAPTAASLTAGAVTLDCSLNNFFTLSLTANAVVTLTNISDGDRIRIRIAQDATGSRTLAFTTTQTKEYVGNVAPTPTATASHADWWYFERCGNRVLVYARQDIT